ncbi:MAG TPA: SGNH/GDSL hydrolase family protein [Anaerolineales bacterium]
MNTKTRPIHIFTKALILFVLIDVSYGLIQPSIAEYSAYNVIFPGLKRMPFETGENPYSITIEDVDVMFAAHEISTEKRPDEIRVALIGDSSVFGESLSNDDTLAGQWNRANNQCNGKTIKIYNLGYPHPSIIKDLVFIDEAAARKPDLVVWFITLNTMMNQHRQNPFIDENRLRALQIMETYDLPLGTRKELSERPTHFYDQTLLGQRTFLARWLKLQALGLIWLAVGDDLPVSSLELMLSHDVKKSPVYRDMLPGADLRPSLLLDSLPAGYDLAEGIPILLVNEPIFIAQGFNSSIRYNDLYPRWVYDQYRDILAGQTSLHSWQYLDLWDAVPPEYFTNSPLHVNAEGERLLMEQIAPSLLSMVCK